MAKLYITEYTAPSSYQASNTGLLAEPGTDQTPVAVGAGSLQSAAFASNTQLIRLHTDSICSIVFGTNPTATANSRRLNANATEYFLVPLGASYKVAVIQNT